MRPTMSVVVALCLFGIGANAVAEQPRERCEECPRVALVAESDVLHVVSEDDRDDPEDLSHRLRLVVGGQPTDWTDWDTLAAYRVRTAVPVTVEAQSRDLEGFVGTGVIEVEPAEAEAGPIGPGTVAENGREDKRWSDDATQPDDGSRPPEEPEIAPVSAGDDPWDASHGECPPPSCSTGPTNPASWPAVVLMLLVSAGLLGRRSIGARSS